MDTSSDAIPTDVTRDQREALHIRKQCGIMFAIWLLMMAIIATHQPEIQKLHWMNAKVGLLIIMIVVFAAEAWWTRVLNG